MLRKLLCMVALCAFVVSFSSMAYHQEKILICNSCPNNIASVALQASVKSGKSELILHVINNTEQRLDSYKVEYFPESRYFHVERDYSTSSVFKKEVADYFSAVLLIQTAEFDSSTYPFRSAWDLVGSEGNQQQVAENFINSRDIYDNLAIINQFVHKKAVGILADSSDLLIQRWVTFSDGTRALIDIVSVGMAGERMVKVIAMRTKDGKLIPLSESDLYKLKRVEFEFRERKTLKGFAEAMSALGVPVIGIGDLYDHIDRGGSVTVTNCDTGSCTGTKKEKPAVNPN